MEHKGGSAWLGLAAYVAAYDYYACKHGHETLSGAFGRAMHHRAARWPTIVAVAMLLKHLMFPKVLEQYDPLNKIAERWRVRLKTPGYNLVVEQEQIVSFPRSLP